MKYFAKITSDHWTLKNKVNEQARKVAYEMDNTLLQDDGDRGKFLAIFSEKIHLVNKSNPRCTPLELHIYRRHLGAIRSGEECYATVSRNFNMSIFPVKHEGS